MNNKNTKEIFLNKISKLLSTDNKMDTGSITLNLNIFANDKSIEYDEISLDMTFTDNILTLKGVWDLENILDDDEEKECFCDENDDEDDCCCFEDDDPCDIYDNRFDNFEDFLEEDFEILHDTRIYLATESLIISKLSLKLKSF